MTEKAGRFLGVHSPDPDILIMIGLHTESIGETKKKRGNQLRPKALSITVSGLAIEVRTIY